MGVGAAIAILASIVSAGLGGDLVDTSFTLRAIYRVFWCVLLELPWCCAFARTNRESDQYVPGRLDLGLALAAALVLPGAYALHVADEETKRIEGMLEHGRVLKARAALELVRQLGAHEPIRIKNRDYVEQNMSIAELRKYLDTEIERSTEIVKSPLPWSAPLAYKLEQCRRLGMLDRCEEAERQLRPLASTDLDAKWLLGWVLQERERWDESSASIREVLEARVGKADSDPRALERSLACFNELAYNARGKGDYAAAEAIYFEALDRLPSSAGAYFHFLLGQHYSKGGRPASAIEHLRQAADLDPVKYREQSRKIIDGLRRSTPACVLK
jgi:tetratricopeptide (TPR) repeat protein